MSAQDAELLGLVFYGGAIGLILLGLYAMTASRHMMRIVLGLVLVESGVNLFLVAVGYRPDAVAPILAGQAASDPMVDPLPQALVLTAIVIGVGVLALALSLMIRVHQSYGTLDAKEIAERIARETGDLGADPEPANDKTPVPALHGPTKSKVRELVEESESLS